LFSAEHGPNRHDEINIIQKGANYGWPDVCGKQEEATIEPIRCYRDFTLAPGSLASLDNKLYVTGLRGIQLRELVIVNNQIVEENVVIDSLGRLRDVVAYNNDLYLSTSNKDGRGIPGIDDDKIIKRGGEI
jgi:glucose/arabinose dehydrogenase